MDEGGKSHIGEKVTGVLLPVFPKWTTRFSHNAHRLKVFDFLAFRP